MPAAVVSALAILISHLYGRETGILISLMLFLTVILGNRRGKKASGEKQQRIFRQSIILCCLFLLNTMNLSASQLNAETLATRDGEELTISGRVFQRQVKQTGAGESYTEYRLTSVELREEGKASEKLNMNVLVRDFHQKEEGTQESMEAAEGFLPGCRITVQGEFQLPEEQKNPGCFNYRLYLLSQEIGGILSAREAAFEEQEILYKLQGKLYEGKEAFLKKLEKQTDSDTAGFVRGVLFGEKNWINESVLEEFQANGTAHILAVSGLHIGILYGFFCMLWPWKKGGLFFGLVLFFFSCYGIMSGLAPSVVRAGVMVGMHAFAKWKHLRYDFHSAAFFIFLLMLLNNPMELFHTGFQMSFLAILTLALVLPAVKRIYSGLFAASAAIQVGLMPYTAYTFNYLSLAAIFVNVPIIFLTGILVPMGICAMAVSNFWPGLFSWMASCISGLCTMLIQLNGATAAEGITVYTVTSPPPFFLALYYLLLFTFLSEEGRLLFLRKRKKILIALAMVILAASVLWGQTMKTGFESAQMVFVDVGQGDCMHIKTCDDQHYFIDGGGSVNNNVGKKTLKPYLLKNGVRKLDGALVTHLHTDHYQGIVELCREGMVERLYLYEGNRLRQKEILQETGLEPEQLTYLVKGDGISLGEDLKVDVLWPEKKTERQYRQMLAEEADENQSSLILRVSLPDLSMIATGDVDEACQDLLARQWGSVLKSDVLKVAHHGSKYSYSQAFAEAVDPDHAVFQVGKNNFGHPNEGVVENYLRNGIMIYRNDLDGAVGFRSRRNGTLETVTVVERGD